MNSFLEKITKKMYPDDKPPRESLFINSIVGTFIAGLITILVFLFLKFSVWAILTVLIAVIILTVLFYVSNKMNKQFECLFMLAFLINFIFFPILFFTCGGPTGGMQLFVMLGLIYTIVLLNGKSMYIMLTSEIIFDFFLYYIAYKYPSLIIDFKDRTHLYLSSYIFMMTSTILLAIITNLILFAYHKESKKVKDLLAQVRELSIKDPLTGVYNRRFMLETLEHNMNMAKRENSPLCIIMYDIDNFKSINDTYGHIIGDNVLKKICEIFLNSCRKGDIVARYGGEEFIIIMPSSDIENTLKRAEEIRIMVSETIIDENIKEQVTVSGGIAQFNDNDDISRIIKKADENLYFAKQNGKNQIVK